MNTAIIGCDTVGSDESSDYTLDYYLYQKSQCVNHIRLSSLKE
jgi:hypothetical protein